MKITVIDPFSSREERIRPSARKDKPLVSATNETVPPEVKKEESGDRLLNIIEAAQQRAKKRQNFRDHKRKRAFQAYTLVLKGGVTLQDRGKKLDTRA